MMKYLPLNLCVSLCLLMLLAVLMAGCDAKTESASNEQTVAITNDITQLTVSYDEQSNRYTLNWQASDAAPPVTVAVAHGTQPYQIVAEAVQANSYQYQADSQATRYQFKVTPEQGREAVAATRWLTLEGGKNFRDLGGYTTTDGQQVRWGKLFRSGALVNLSEQDYQELNELHITTVVDFRNTQERAAEPTNWQGDNTEVLSWDYDMDMGAFGQVFMQPDLTAAKVESFMANMYPFMAKNLDAHYTAMFDRLAASDDGLVFNCTAGKDRTGIAAALILTALGVDRQTIIDDFMLSDVYYTQMVDGRQALGKVASNDEVAKGPHNAAADMFAKLPPEVIEPLTSVRESYIQTTFDSMEEQSGSVLAYIQSELDVTDAELKLIRKHFLQPVNGYQ